MRPFLWQFLWIFCGFLWIYARKSQKNTMFHSVSKNVKQGDLSSKLEPALGFEPRTDGLQNRSSTAELSRLHCMCWYSVRLPLGHTACAETVPCCARAHTACADALSGFRSNVTAFNADHPVKKCGPHLIPGNIIWHIFSKSQTLSLSFSRFRGIVS